MTENRLLCIGKIASPHGVRGEIKLLLYLEETSLLQSGHLIYDESGKPLSLTSFRSGPKNFFLIKLEGVTSREEVDSLKGMKLYMDRSALPEKIEEEAYYIEDLKGLRVLSQNLSDPIDSESSITAVHNFGAGDILEIRLDNKTYFIPFRKEAVSDVSVKERWVKVNPTYLLQNESKPKEDGDAEG